MSAYQLDLFETTEDVEILKSEIKSVKESSDKVRKSMFARHNELLRLYLDMKDRVDILERNICQSDVSKI